VFSKHIQAIKENTMTFVELIQFGEQVYALVQQLKTNGTWDKFIAAEQAAVTEMQTDPLVKELETTMSSFFAKQVITAAPSTVTTTTIVTPKA
jgi:hypothetical protein